MFMFDNEGALLYQEENVANRTKSSITQASMFFTSFDTYRLEEQENKDIPVVFGKFHSLARTRKTAVVGKYLLCILGDNYIGKTAFSLIAVPTVASEEQVSEIIASDRELVETKISIDDFKLDFMQLKEALELAKTAYETAIGRAKEEDKKVEAMLRNREDVYDKFLASCESAFNPQESAEVIPNNTSKILTTISETSSDFSSENAEVGISTAATEVAPTAVTVRRASAIAAAAATAAATTASSAAGWIGGRLSGIVSTVRGRLVSSSTKSVEGEGANSQENEEEPSDGHTNTDASVGSGGVVSVGSSAVVSQSSLPLTAFEPPAADLTTKSPLLAAFVPASSSIPTVQEELLKDDTVEEIVVEENKEESKPKPSLADVMASLDDFSDSGISTPTSSGVEASHTKKTPSSSKKGKK